MKVYSDGDSAGEPLTRKSQGGGHIEAHGPNDINLEETELCGDEQRHGRPLRDAVDAVDTSGFRVNTILLCDSVAPREIAPGGRRFCWKHECEHCEEFVVAIGEARPDSMDELEH